MRYAPHEYQEYAERKLIELPEAGLFMDMGLGKTVTTLTAIDELMHDRFLVSRVLVIAPKRVAEDTWTTEAEKWDHLRHLEISRVLGSRRERENRRVCRCRRRWCWSRRSGWSRSPAPEQGPAISSASCFILLVVSGRAALLL